MSPELLSPGHLARAGIHPIAVPTPFPVGPVNVYLVEDDPLTLVDAGPRSDLALQTLEAGLAARGHAVEDLGRLVLTHQHPDHVGLVATLAERSGAEVCALAALVPWLADHAAAAEEDDAFVQAVMERHGVPAELRAASRAASRDAATWGGGAHVDTPLAPGAALPFRDRTWTVHHRPGHSPSDTVFEDTERRLLVGGDHLLGSISSNPLLSRPLGGGAADERPQALVTYLASMRATRAMELDVVLPGHGDPVTDHRALVDERLRQHERRAGKIGRILAGGPATAHEIAVRMWGTLAVSQALLTMSEVLGHVDLLLARGAAVEARGADGRSRFAAA